MGKVVNFLWLLFAIVFIVTWHAFIVYIIWKADKEGGNDDEILNLILNMG